MTYPAPFFILTNPFITLRHSRSLIHYFGLKGFCKQLIKSTLGNRVFYGFLSDKGELISCGYLNIGFCKFYEVSTHDVVIGSIWTNPEHRGKGLATKGIMAAINEMMARGYRSFYIDTQTTNAPMLKSISHLGFGEAISQFISE